MPSGDIADCNGNIFSASTSVMSSVLSERQSSTSPSDKTRSQREREREKLGKKMMSARNKRIRPGEIKWQDLCVCMCVIG